MKTNKLQHTQIGDTISIAMGAVLPHAIKVETLFSTICEPKGQLVASGKVVKADGHSEWRLGEKIEACVWLQL